MIDIVNKEIFDEKDAGYFAEWCAKIEQDCDLMRNALPLMNHFHNAVDLINETDIHIPVLPFTKLIYAKRQEYIKLFPYKVKVIYMTESNNYWTKYTNYLGIHHEDGSMTLHLRKDGEHSQLSLLWILLHEFRHKIQAATLSISTNLDNSNFRHFMDYLKRKDNTENNINHVFHEIMPYEIDANIFACELLDIKYPGSKFEINDYTMSFLK